MSRSRCKYAVFIFPPCCLHQELPTRIFFGKSWQSQVVFVHAIHVGSWHLLVFDDLWMWLKNQLSFFGIALKVCPHSVIFTVMHTHWFALPKKHISLFGYFFFNPWFYFHNSRWAACGGSLSLITLYSLSKLLTPLWCWMTSFHSTRGCVTISAFTGRTYYQRKK